MKKKITLSLDDKLVKDAKAILSKAPKKSLSAFVDECLDKFIKENK